MAEVVSGVGRVVGAVPRPPELRRLLTHQATGAAGDALVALALAGSLFFSVPETTARGRVGLYLALTVAPFAVIAPLLARILDRFRGSLRWAMVVTSIGRATLAWWMATRLDSLLLFPLAFGILMLSRAALVVRGAMLPTVVAEGATLVDANSSLSRVSAVAGMVAGLPGLAIAHFLGAEVELLFAAAVYYLGAIPALRLPRTRGKRKKRERLGARAVARSRAMRQAVMATSGMRFLVGYLVFHLAFALRREQLSSIGLGVLIGSAAFGGLAGALVAPRLRKKLSEEGMLFAALVAGGVIGLVVGRWFSLITAGALVFVFGIASGSAKVAFDSIVQRELPEGARGWAFARFESTLQLAWVAGAAAPLI
ncbi:MAG: MFS transporter, partial [Actinomycetota bacterium]|nr:MFS transporter [Actinomycetota bacterium]